MAGSIVLLATSQLFLQNLQKPKSEDQLPISSTGAIQDVHVTAFQSAADSLLTAGRYVIHYPSLLLAHKYLVPIHPLVCFRP
jgi:hypothetical protein